MNHQPLNAHLWDKHQDGWYVEPDWVSNALFKAIKFEGGVWDPACGRGNILFGACAAGKGSEIYGTDLVQRGEFVSSTYDFLTAKQMPKAWLNNIVTNPPFDKVQEFAEHALKLLPQQGKLAMIVPTRRLNAAGAWLSKTPLKRILYLTPRPSMPPGPVYEALLADGKTPSGGTQDFCWLVWYRNPIIKCRVGWLHRDNGLTLK